MRIAVLTASMRPVPAVKGGAVENLIDFYLAYNDRHRLHDITVYSIDDPQARRHPAVGSSANHYHYINVRSRLYRLRRWIYLKRHGDRGYYHYSMEFFLKDALKHIRRQAYDVLLIENRPAFALLLQHQTNARIVYHIHNKELDASTKLAADIYGLADQIITVSDYISQCVRTINPADPKCVTVYNGIDTRLFYEASPMPREDIGLSNDDFVIVFSGRLTIDKGILELVRAVARLKDIPNLRLVIIGASSYGADSESSPYVQKLQAEAQAVSDKIVFTGYVDYRRIPAYLKMADIAVLPSMWEEPFGLTIVEAMAAGLPLITTRSGGIPEICEGVATIVSREGIVDRLAAAIIDLYQHPEKRKAMSAAALYRSKQFDKETYARNFFKAIESIESTHE